MKQEIKQKLIRIDNQGVQLDEISEETTDEECDEINKVIGKIEKKKIEEGKTQILNYMKKIIESKKSKKNKK